MKIKHASQSITIAIVMFSLLAISCLVLARRSWTVAQRAYETRQQMLALTDRLAAGSDRLTAAVRAYAATGDRRYYDEFQQELHVDRNRDVALSALERLGLAADEQELVARAKRNSDRLVGLEDRAFAAVERGNVTEAIGIVYGPDYSAAKTSIMEPIAECRRKLDRRLSDNAATVVHRASILDTVALITLLLNALSILTALILFYRRRVVNPLGEIARSLKELIAKRDGASIGHQDDTSEIGEVARSIEQYRLTVVDADRQRWVKTSLAEIADGLLGTEQPAEFGGRLLSALMPLIGAGCGTFHLFDEGDGRFHAAGGYGLESTPHGSFAIGEGIAGQAAAERKLIHLADLPDDYLRIGSSLGQARARSLSIVPIVAEHAVLAVLEIASFSALSEDQKTLLQEVAEMAALKLDALRRNLRTRELLEQVRHTNFLADTALDLTKAGYWHVPLDGSGWYNSSERAARIFGDPPAPDHRYTLEHWTEHVFAGDETAAKATMENFSAAVAGTIPSYDATYAYKRPVDGRVVWIHALGHVVKDGSGKPTDMYGVTQDITDFKMLELALTGAKQKAEEATQMKSMFLANMSHEIRTPMNAIIGLSHLALKTELTVKQRDYVSKIHNAGTSLLAVVNDILDFSKIEAGKLDIESTDFRLDDVIDSVITVTSQKAHEKGLEFLARIPASVPQSLIGDPLRLGQILTNLVNNAVKFTERGEIRLKVELLERTGEKCQLRFSVEDTGIGMTREQAARLFQPFTQADMSTTRKHGGTGLGLTISRRLVELMGGQIWLESEPERGSTFSFTSWFGVGEQKSAGHVIPERLATLDVLVADDSPEAAEILQDALRDIVRSVRVVASGEDAVAAVRRQPYDVVILDWRMPRMDGIEAARIIRNDKSLQQPAIALVTAFDRDDVRDGAEPVHLDGFLLKPVTRSMLLDFLVNVVGAPVPSAKEQEREAERFPGLRVLLAEDNEINQQIAIELLQRSGAAVDIANNGREAVEKVLRGNQYHLVLMDLQMPEMDGYEAAARIRSEPRFARLPIIAMTAHATLEERQRCLDAGMNDHVVKPIDPVLLFDTVGRHYKPEASILSVEGLDTENGLARVGGNRALYLKLLRQFLDLGSTPAQIAGALAGGDWPLAERLAHTVNGVAGSLGADAVHHAAAQLEQALRERSSDGPLLEPLLAEFRTTLGDVIARLRTALPEDAPPPPKSPENGAANARILIVEDAPVNIQALSGVLRDNGYGISVASTGRQALEILGVLRPDLILLDVMMPDVDGFETCARIKSSPEWRDIPIIFLTAKTATNDIVRGFELGAVDYVAKPFHAHELLARVNTHLAIDRLRKENERLIRDESELARHRSVAQMVAGVAHEINTPLGIMNTAAGMITSRLSSPLLGVVAETSDGQMLLEDLGEASSLITRNVTRAHKLVQDFKKISVNQITDVRETVKLAEVVAETADLFRVTARTSRMQVAVTNTLPDQVGEWTGYPGSLSQVLLNLLSNAQRYAYDEGVGGHVEIVLGADDSTYRIAVRDSGKGIPAENLPRIFDPFFTTGRGKGGSGLGMAIVYNIVTAQMKGAIAVDSTPGAGTTVTFTVPRVVPE